MYVYVCVYVCNYVCMYDYMHCIDTFRKLDLLQPGIQETFSIAVQTLITFLALNILSFYYEWRLALFLVINWPLGMIASVVMQQVSLYNYVRICNMGR